jgi:hypothetical protein
MGQSAAAVTSMSPDDPAALSSAVSREPSARYTPAAAGVQLATTRSTRWRTARARQRSRAAAAERASQPAETKMVRAPRSARRATPAITSSPAITPNRRPSSSTLSATAHASPRANHASSASGRSLGITLRCRISGLSVPSHICVVT